MIVMCNFKMLIQSNVHYTGLKVNFLVYLQSFASKIFFHKQTGTGTLEQGIHLRDVMKKIASKQWRNMTTHECTDREQSLGVTLASDYQKAQPASILFLSDVVRTFILAFQQCRNCLWNVQEWRNIKKPKRYAREELRKRKMTSSL